MITIDEARNLYRGADGVHDFDHILRVLTLAERIARAEGADWEIVRSATLLHDWARGYADAHGLDHARLGAEWAARWLTERGFAPQQVAAITHAIAAHRFRSQTPPQTLEAQVLFDADKLDAIGAVGVARAFAYGGAQGQRLWADSEQVDLSRWEAEGDDAAHTPVHEFVVKLSRIKDRLYTAEGRRIARDRHQFMAAFYRRMALEVAGEA